MEYDMPERPTDSEFAAARKVDVYYACLDVMGHIEDSELEPTQEQFDLAVDLYLRYRDEGERAWLDIETALCEAMEG